MKTCEKLVVGNEMAFIEAIAPAIGGSTEGFSKLAGIAKALCQPLYLEGYYLLFKDRSTSGRPACVQIYKKDDGAARHLLGTVPCETYVEARNLGGGYRSYSVIAGYRSYSVIATLRPSALVEELARIGAGGAYYGREDDARQIFIQTFSQ